MSEPGRNNDERSKQGRHVHGWTIPAGKAQRLGAVPVGLVEGAQLTRDVEAGQIITYADVSLDEQRPLVAMRRLQDVLVAAGVI